MRNEEAIIKEKLIKRVQVKEIEEKLGSNTTTSNVTTVRNNMSIKSKDQSEIKEELKKSISKYTSSDKHKKRRGKGSFQSFNTYQDKDISHAKVVVPKLKFDKINLNLNSKNLKYKH